MARKPRLHLPGGIYHAMLRGNAGQPIFFSDEDRCRLYLLLQEGIARFNYRVHGFCLMDNHLHLAIQVADIPLSKIMQNLDLAFRYTQWVEPNSSLGKAFNYLLNHWPELTRFLWVPDAPLENNAVERALKLMIRQRKNSLFYAGTHSAYVASLLTSLIATCAQAGVNALAYLVALQDHRSQVFQNPGAWLPWNYTDSLTPS